MTPLKVDNNALSNIIKEHVVQDIILGNLKPGDKLVESKYAEEFGISRAPIREAFNILALEGIVEKIPRKETIVKGYTNEEIHDLIHMRKYLEGLALEKLSNKDNKAFIEDMRQIVNEMEKQTNSEEYIKLNLDFHQRIISESGSYLIGKMYSLLGTLLHTLLRVALMEKNNNDSLSEHKRVIELLAQGNIKEAQKELEHHNESVLKYIAVPK